LEDEEVLENVNMIADNDLFIPLVLLNVEGRLFAQQLLNFAGRIFLGNAH